MKVGLIDVDRFTYPKSKFPNLALMKISAWHKKNGDEVKWCTNAMEHFDLVYQSKVFDETYVPDLRWIPNADEVRFGGSGYDLQNSLPAEIEHVFPDYELYAEAIPKIRDTAIGFLTRGCPRNCDYCIVTQKEGRCSIKVADLCEFWNGQKDINLLDPNLLACREKLDLLEQLVLSRAYVNFSQGLDIRLADDTVIEKLNKMRVKRLHFAWDHPEQDLRPYFERFTAQYKRKDSRSKIVYVLTNYDSTMEQNLFRIYELERMGYNADVRVFDKPNAPKEILRLQRWCNNRIIHGKCPRFEGYKD